MNLYSPLSGTVLALESVPDPVFAGFLLGPGIAVDPSETGTITVVSPVAGTVTAARSHAVIVDQCLIHAGVDTFRSEALTCLVEKDADIRVGTPLISVDLDRLGDLPSTIIVSFPEHDRGAWHQLAAPGTRVQVGDLIGTLD